MKRTYQTSADGDAEEFLEILTRTVLDEMPARFDAIVGIVQPDGSCRSCGGPRIDFLFQRGEHVGELHVCPSLLGAPGAATPQEFALHVCQRGQLLLALAGA